MMVMTFFLTIPKPVFSREKRIVKIMVFLSDPSMNERGHYVNLNLYSCSNRANNIFQKCQKKVHIRCLFDDDKLKNVNQAKTTAPLFPLFIKLVITLVDHFMKIEHCGVRLL